MRQFPGARWAGIMQCHTGRAEQSGDDGLCCVPRVCSEACAATSIGTMNDRNLGQTGPPLSCCEVRLESIPDMNYLCTDKHPRGEICVRGPNVSPATGATRRTRRPRSSTDGCTRETSAGSTPTEPSPSSTARRIWADRVRCSTSPFEVRSSRSRSLKTKFWPKL